MTCIVGLVDRKTVWIGGDSAGIAGLSRMVRHDPKVFTNGSFVFGFTTSFRMGQLLQHAFTPPLRNPKQDVHEYMVTDFIDGVRSCLKKGGYAETKNDAEYGGTFLVGYEGRLFKICGDYQVGEALHGYDACGCAEDIALGSMHSTTSLPAGARIEAALQAAEYFSAGVASPYTILKVTA